MLLTTLALLTLAALAGWWAGGVLLRTSGTLLILAGLTLTALGSTPGLVLAVIGVASWLLGQLHHAGRHHEYTSPLARRVFTQLLPERLDLTRGWATPTTSEPAREHRPAGRPTARRLPATPRDAHRRIWHG